MSARTGAIRQLIAEADALIAKLEQQEAHSQGVMDATPSFEGGSRYERHQALVQVFDDTLPHLRRLRRELHNWCTRFKSDTP